MKVLLIRHGAAEDQAVFARTGQPDEKRPLTAEGVAEMRDIAAGLREVVKEISVIATSPLVRAEQTAALVGEVFPNAMCETIASMVPGQPYAAFLSWLKSKQQKKCVAAVGHEPHISGLASWLLGNDRPILEMKKGSALLIEFDDELRAGAGQLRWFMPPKQIIALGARR